MNGLGFTCSYTKIKDVEQDKPCGRRAARHGQGEPKCLGHHVVSRLLTIIGGTEFTRKVWIALSYLLIALSVDLVQSYWNVQPYLLVALSLVVFGVGLFIVCIAEHPFGGLVCLCAAIAVGLFFLRVGISSFEYFTGPNPELPSGDSRPIELLNDVADIAAGLIFVGCWSGFVLLHRWNDRGWFVFTRGLSIVLAVVLPIIIAAEPIISKGGYGIAVLPGPVGLLIAGVVLTRGGQYVKRFAKRIRV